MELRQQKQEHQRLRKRSRLGQGVETKAATSQHRRRTVQKNHTVDNEGGIERKAASGSERDTEQTSECSNNDERREGVLETGSIGAAAAILKQQQQQQLLKLQQHNSDNLQHELQLLEKRLGFRRSSKKTSQQAQAKVREKLREELRRDGFDLDLQDMLEDIGVRRALAYCNRATLGKSRFAASSVSFSPIACLLGNRDAIASTLYESTGSFQLFLIAHGPQGLDLTAFSVAVAVALFPFFAGFSQRVCGPSWLGE